MRFLYFAAKFIVWAGLLAIVQLSCKPPKGRLIQSPPGYDFSQPFTNKLDLKLKEISGITWDSKADEFLAHNDESGKLFFLDEETKDIKREYKFAGRGDYEDVALYDGIPYILRSDGMITRIIIDSAGNARGEEAGKPGISGTNDFETMYADTSRKALIIICKNCHMDNKESVSAFAFYPELNQFDETPVFTIDAGNVKSLSPFKTSKLQPSAAAIHPILHKLFILSSASNQLAISDLNGNVESVFELSKKLFPQPEGITFRNNGDMYISNEGVTSRGIIHRFLYRAKP